ncbi:diaminopimelate epimerase [Roseivirga seohaensis]|uniref:Diaminopimelate epimerase n=1 Tax=Roseivirga seohaensis TaxID=1914963 RepID=A0A150Y3K3_9BACT|nr:diaminopimelate epimerase [Roseivirga seohaensis]KYG85445.1 diaminopimelate epimerase [Roseivirga seohaensis]
MVIQFHKYQGTGNDFVMIDNRDLKFDKSDLLLIGRLCDRRFGVGADGVILIENHPELDFEMIYFNPDGSQSLCGNGSRCAVMFAKSLGIIDNETGFLAIDGVHSAFIDEDEVHLLMNDVAEHELIGNDFLINTGSPHYIKYVPNAHDIDVVQTGRDIRYSDRFKEDGVNVNFIEECPNNSLVIRTYERGVENETLSCGTGCTAAALSFALKGAESPIRLNAVGGELQVSFNQEGDIFKDIYLIGPAEKVFEGVIEL